MTSRSFAAFILLVPAAFCGLFIGCLLASSNEPKVHWFNDGVYYWTNTIPDVERNRKEPQPSQWFYYKDSVVTNKIRPLILTVGDRPAELGAREDGVVVWRYCK